MCVDVFMYLLIILSTELTAGASVLNTTGTSLLIFLKSSNVIIYRLDTTLDGHQHISNTSSFPLSKYLLSQLTETDNSLGIFPKLTCN